MKHVRRWVVNGTSNGTPRAEVAVPEPVVANPTEPPAASQAARRAAPIHKRLISLGLAGLVTFEKRGS